MPPPSPSASKLAPRRIEPKLQQDAIGVAQDTVIGMASAAPGVSVGLTLAALAAASAYAEPLVIAVTAVPMRRGPRDRSLFTTRTSPCRAAATGRPRVCARTELITS